MDGLPSLGSQAEAPPHSTTASRGALWHATRELHHAAEKHPVGAAMADGSISQVWWVQWLDALSTIHRRLDPHMPPVLHRVEELERDLRVMRLMGFHAQPNRAAIAYAHGLRTSAALEGAGYVFTGAHLMGGAITNREIQGRLPTAHLRWHDRKLSIETWRPWREATGIEREAKAAFQAVLDIMDEIVLRGT